MAAAAFMLLAGCGVPFFFGGSGVLLGFSAACFRSAEVVTTCLEDGGFSFFDDFDEETQQVRMMSQIRTLELRWELRKDER